MPCQNTVSKLVKNGEGVWAKILKLLMNLGMASRRGFEPLLPP